MFHAGRAVATQDEIAEVGIGHPRNARRFVDSPLLYREIGNGGAAHALRLRLQFEALGGYCDRHAGLVADDKTASETLGYSGGRPAANEEIRHHVALVR